MTIELATSRTSGCGSPAANSACSRLMTSVVPERNVSTSTSGYSALNAPIISASRSSGCDVYSIRVPDWAEALPAKPSANAAAPAAITVFIVVSPEWSCVSLDVSSADRGRADAGRADPALHPDRAGGQLSESCFRFLTVNTAVWKGRVTRDVTAT